MSMALAAGLEEGAVGLSSGLDYVPSTPRHDRRAGAALLTRP